MDSEKENGEQCCILAVSHKSNNCFRVTKTERWERLFKTHNFWKLWDLFHAFFMHTFLLTSNCNGNDKQRNWRKRGTPIIQLNQRKKRDGWCFLPNTSWKASFVGLIMGQKNKVWVCGKGTFCHFGVCSIIGVHPHASACLFHIHFGTTLKLCNPCWLYEKSVREKKEDTVLLKNLSRVLHKDSRGVEPKI